MCYKRRRIGRRIRPKDCMIFVFSRSIIIAEEGELVRDAPQLEYWCGFPVSIFKKKLRNVLMQNTTLPGSSLVCAK